MIAGRASNPGVAGASAFVYVLDASYALIAQTMFAPGVVVSVGAVAVTTSGDILVCGTRIASGFSGFVSRLDSTLAGVTTLALDASAGLHVGGCALDSGGELIVTGSFAGTHGTTAATPGKNNLFLMRVAPGSGAVAPSEDLFAVRADSWSDERISPPLLSVGFGFVAWVSDPGLSGFHVVKIAKFNATTLRFL